MKEAKCIKGFMLEECDDDGFMIENQYCDVEENSIWDIEEGTFRVVGGEIRLVHDKFGWIEITEETFERYFEVIS